MKWLVFTQFQAKTIRKRSFICINDFGAGDIVRYVLGVYFLTFLIGFSSGFD